MTNAIKIAKKSKIIYTIHEYKHDPLAQSYGIEAAQKLDIDDKRVFKTLVVITEDKKFAVGLVPVSLKLSLKSIAKAINSKKVTMAEARDVERVTGYVLGGVSPLGQKKRLNTIIDESARNFETIFVSAGKRGLEIELKPDDLISLTNGKLNSISQ